jgi:hypothetical protein
MENESTMERHLPRIRFLLMGLSALSLLVALWTGLMRLGWPLPLGHPTLPFVHGPLMVCGFLGTLIGVERAVAFGQRWPYVVPLLSGVGALGLLAGLPAAFFMVLSSVGLAIVCAVILHRQKSFAMATMTLGTLLWLVGNGCWLAGWPLARVVPWWMGFLVLTIAGERLEISRLLRLSQWSKLSFALALGLFLAGVLWAPGDFDRGVRMAGAGMIALAAWLLRYDIARRTVHHQELTRFIAVCLLSGYGWLAISGVFAVCLGGVMAGPYYDALLHALFLGFIFTMIFAHGPIIFPAIIGRPVPYHPLFYAPVGVLHAALGLRVAGDMLGWPAARQWGGLFNAVAILGFLATLGWLMGWRKPSTVLSSSGTATPT